MTDWYDHENENVKPGGMRSFGGGKINKHRKIHDVPQDLVQALQNTAKLIVRSGWVYNMHNYDFGVICNNIDEFLNHGDWKPFLRKHLPHVSVSTVGRRRRIASNIDFATYPSFYAIPQDHLLKMLRKYSFDEAVNLLEKNGANLCLDQNDETGIEKFQRLFKLLLKGQLQLLPGEEESEESSLDDENNNPSAEESDTQFPDKGTDPIVENYVAYIENLHQSHDDVGLPLDERTAYALADILVATSNVLLKFAPTKNRGKKFQKLQAFLREIHDVIFDPQFDEEIDTDCSISNDNNDHDTTQLSEKDYLDGYYFKKLIEFEDSLNSQ